MHWARFKIGKRCTSVTNSMALLLAKYNLTEPVGLQDIPKLQYEQLSVQASLLKEQMLTLEKSLYLYLIPNEEIQGLLWILGIGKRNAFTIALEIYDINRFADVKHFCLCADSLLLHAITLANKDNDHLKTATNI